MKRTLLVTLLLTVATMFALPLQAEEMPKQTMKMYHIVMAKKGPNWKSQGSEDGMDVRMQVIDGVKKAAKSGLLVSAGLVNDETDVEFIFIFDLETKTETYNLIMKLKNVKKGFFTPEIYSYFAPEGLGFKK